ncbi:hypothetical protein IQ249_10895 [Lusitaniella coriacea LEGE 07157]|uniref:Cold shock domain-containing protein n=1 Tax=Lusitaniella coriacea LEGE 07157 TaxID=945747 RepID=A0A8J7DWE1_9CYAN|nr:hypothetical protein [Lusitaniella coriacea]MBE9116406.1 hypothetical protein [Lusitaniella coriacea LEGE 07157]
MKVGEVMKIGKIKFFGKRSPKTGKKYGFVSVADTQKDIQDIYFNEGNVPSGLDDRLNPGTYVSVRIVTNCDSKNEAVIEEVKSWDGVGNIKYFKNGLFSVYCEDGIIRKGESLLERKAVTKDIFTLSIVFFAQKLMSINEKH